MHGRLCLLCLLILKHLDDAVGCNTRGRSHNSKSLVYTKTTIHLSQSVASGGYLPSREAVNNK